MPTALIRLDQMTRWTGKMALPAISNCRNERYRMNNTTDRSFVLSKTKKKHAMQRLAAWQLVIAVALFLVGAYLCLYGPLIGIAVVALGGFSAGLGVSRLRDAASIDNVFRG